MPSRRLREPGHSLSWRALTLALVMCFPASALAAPVGDDTRSVAVPLDPVETWFYGDPASALGLPRDLDGILAPLAARGARASAESAWEAYFAAFGLVPTEDERARLEQALLTHPALMAALEPTLRDVAHAQATRDAIFSPLSDEDRARLVRASLLVATGEGHLLSAEDAALLARLDLSRLESAAAALARDARALEAALPAALRTDARVATAFPQGAAEAVAARDALALLAALAPAADGAAPASWGEVLRLASPSAPIPASATRLPPDLAAALAAVAGPVLAAHATPSPEDDRAALSAVAAAMPALARASYNISLRGPGDLQELAGTSRPIEGMRRTGGEQASAVLADLLGPAAAPPAVPLAQGHADLRAALGLPQDAAVALRVQDLERKLGRDLSLAVGTLLAAQARYQRDLAPDAPVPTLARERAADVAPLLATGGPLLPGDLQRLAQAAEAHTQLRLLSGLRAGEVLAALDALQVPMARSPVPLTGLVYRDETLVVWGTDANDVSPDVLPLTPVLLLDLGGDDRYTAPVGGIDASEAGTGFPVDAEAARTAIAVDLGGNDEYVSARPFTMGAARGSPFSPALGILADVSGDDRYRGNASLGAGVDGIGILLDRDGDDHYEADAGLGLASSQDGGIAAGVLVDLAGADAYRTREGFARLRNESLSPLTAAVFVDVAGPDAYLGECPRVGDCVARPRNMEPVYAPGVLVFIDGGGRNEWPNGNAPRNHTTSQNDVSIDLFDPFNRTRFVYVQDGMAFPDGDGDLLFDVAEQQVGQDPARPLQDDLSAGDRDGDGWPDHVEAVLRSDPDDAGSVPFGLPRPPGPLPDPYGFLPNGGDGIPGRASSNHMLVDLRGLLAVGLPGTTVYRESYRLSIDLGLEGVLDMSASDRYYGNTSADSIAIDLGGNDLYAPEPMANGASRRLGTSQGLPSLLLDLGGDDHYVVEQDGLAHAAAQRYTLPQNATVAILIDAAGHDTYVAPRGGAQAYAGEASAAYFVDLGGNDHYRTLTQGVAHGNASIAVFVDAEGDDNYTRPPSETDLSRWHDHQGASPPAGFTVVPPIAAFFDLGGRDEHNIWRGAAYAEAPERNNRLRIRPVDEPRGGAVAVYLDTSLVRNGAVENTDSDGWGDAAETAAGTSSGNASRSPTGPGFHLDLPRLGIAIGNDDTTTYRDEYALVVDVGGADVYLNHAGASTPVFPTSVLVDHGGVGDVYHSTRGTNLSAFAHHARTNGTTADVSATFGDAADGALGAAQGAGVLGVGILLDDGGANSFNVTVSTSQCADCVPRAIALGVAQGAGLLGVGILDLPGRGANEFLVDVRANTSSVLAQLPGAVARGVSQGAAVLGVGILANHNLDPDGYRIDTRSTGPMAVRAGAGQGYAARGLGVLLDLGGDNRFSAAGLAQGAADDDHLANPAPRQLTLASWSADHFANAGRPTVAMLLLPGLGADELTAGLRSQAYAGAAGLGILFDAEGNDNRTLLADGSSNLGGQAAASLGTAYLIDNRGDDRYIADAPAAQAHARNGIAVLADLSGSDTYQAGTLSQAVVNTTEVPVTTNNPRVASPGPAIALFVDRMGFDRYVVPHNSLAQAGTIPFSGGAPGAAVFVDAGGRDAYVGRPAHHGGRTPSGNDGAWRAPQTTVLTWVGVDNNAISTAFAAVAAVLYQHDTGATLRPYDLDGQPWPLPTLNHTLLLRASASARGSSIGTATDAFDRAEFQYENQTLGVDRVASGNVFEVTWDTDARDAFGRALFPDGRHDLQVYLYPRVGTPTRTDNQGFRAGVDVEPLPAKLEVRIDNPPRAQPPLVPENLSIAWPAVELPLWIDRDLERGDCPLCADDAHIPAGHDEWDVPLLAPSADAYTNHTCVSPACVPGLTVTSGAGAAYLTWTPPPVDAGRVVGYVLRRHVGDESEVLGVVDPRAPLRHRDADPPQDANYTVGALRQTFTGETIAWSEVATLTPSEAPGPVLGLRARGAEDAVRLAWQPMPEAALFEVQRSLDGEFFETVGWTDKPTHVDQVGAALHDAPLKYRVIPWDGASRPSEVPPMVVAAQAAPGALVSMWLDGPANVTLLRDAPLGGGQLHSVFLDARTVPEGVYNLSVFLDDGAGMPARANTTVVLDRAAPAVEILMPGFAGAAYVGAGGVRVPLRVSDAASGPSLVAAAARVDGGAWLPLGDAFLSNLTLQEDGTHLVNLILPGVANGQTAEIVAVAQDHAGNVGALPPLPFTPRLEDGLRAAMTQGGHLVQFDFLPPVVRGTAVDAAVRPNQTLRLEARVADTGTGLREVQARIGSHVVPLTDQGAFTYVGHWKAVEVGQHQVVFEATDAAGNVGRDAGGVVIVDDAPPVVQEARVTFSGGRTVGTPGEVARVLVRARDAGAQPEALNVTLDASNVSSRGTLRLSWSRHEQVHAAEMVVDRVGPVSDSNVTLLVTDRAGNVARVTVPVAIDAAPAGFETPVSLEVRADRAWFNWTSAEDVRGRVDFGLGPQLGMRSELGPATRNHSVLVTDLTPASRYFAKAVLVTDAGIEAASPLLDFTTSPGLAVDLVPVAGFPHSTGGGKLRLDVRTFDGRASGATAEVFAVPPRGSPALVAEAAAGAEFQLNLSGFRDGTYALVARASSDDLGGQSAPLEVVLDRVAPIVDLPRDVVIVPQRPLVITALERGSGVDVSKVLITVDKKPCVASLVGDTLTCTAPEVTNPVVEVDVRVPDRAGNTGLFTTRLPAAARDGPVLREALLLGETGTDALRPGSQATLSVTADAIGIERVLADLRALGGAEEQEIPSVGPGRYGLTFPVGTNLKTGPVVVPVAAFDRADRKLHLIAAATVDDTPPRAEEVEVLLGETPGTVVVRVVATEDVRIRVDAPGARAERQEYRADTQVALSGLRPGREFQALVTLVDRAGNQATLTTSASSPPDPQPPTLVGELRAVDLGDGHLVLLWAPAVDDVGLDGYRVYRRVGGELRLLGTTADTRFEHEAPAGEDVEYAVAALDLGGNEGEPVAIRARSVAVPHLSDGRVDPPLGGPGIYTFTVNVTQKSGAAPVVEVIVDGRPVRMETDAKDCREACTYRALVTLGPQALEGGGHQFAFVAHHEKLSVRLPEGGQAIQGPVVVGSVASSVLAGASRVPLTPVIGLVGLVVAAGAVAAWRMLRRNSK